MLHVKKASAGSGKTYQLAKMFIKLLLTVKYDGKKRRLRNEESLQEALSSILAVTFTVKATAEMKQRIVKNLAKLGTADAPNMTAKEIEEVPFLTDFIKELNTTRDEIARLSRKALRHLLLHYSDFKVQTIDSFFQSVLHTFAYEASLDDNFNMELDSRYVNSVGFDAALDSLSRKTDDKARQQEVIFWLNKLMKESTDRNKWNVFARQEGKNYLYSELVKETENLEREDFHKIKEELEKYFKNLGRPFRDIVREVEDTIYADLPQLFVERKETAEEVLKELKKCGLSIDDLCQHGPGRIRNSLEYTDPFKTDLIALAGKALVNERKKKDSGHSLSTKGKDRFKKLCRENEGINSSLINDLDSAYDVWAEKYNKLQKYLNENKEILITWEHYKEMLPRLVLVLEITDRKREFLESSNALQISDTAHVLSRIIDGEDTPFVYERMGSRINHYLIDEFQDTSRMQWQNLYPLLSNSEAFEYDNLIIGDAKQSIYRFRNADYRLIQEVDKMFHKVVPYTSDTPPKDMRRENMNFRSKPLIVEFNNFVFSQILNTSQPGKADKEKPEMLFGEEVTEIYKDCVQALPDKEEIKRGVKRSRGYVELIFHPGVGVENGEDTAGGGSVSMNNLGFLQLTDRIMELKERGYEFREISILVQSHDQGSAVIASISKYNNDNPDSQIPVISEENLLVAGALSVRIIIHGLEVAARGEQNPLPVNPILHDPVEEEELFGMLQILPSLALPAVVEAIAEKFVPESRRNDEAPFLAAFQDAVLDYCASHPGDIGQFLKWWKRKSKTLTINSPEESDGVKILTIHKAKGLENKCVILPYAGFNFVPSRLHSEWRWVKPHPDIPGHELLPPYLPLPTKVSLRDTLHADVRNQYCMEVALDELNKMYVGFTRPVEELYIYLPLPKSEGNARASSILLDMVSEETETSGLLSKKFRVKEEGEGRTVVKYGLPAKKVQIEIERENKEKKVMDLERYDISTEGAKMQFENGNKLLNSLPRTLEEGEKVDPRTEGKLKHRVLQLTNRPEDLKKALLEMKREGLINASQLEEWGKELEKAILSVKDYGWFDADKRIISERPIIESKASTNYRPDRVVVDNEGNATVIDYKFGDRENYHKKQVKNYVALLKASEMFASVSGYLWYMPDSQPEKVI